MQLEHFREIPTLTLTEMQHKMVDKDDLYFTIVNASVNSMLLPL